MKPTALYFLTLCLFTVSTAATASAATPTIKCDSAARDPNVPYEEYVRAYHEACYPRRLPAPPIPGVPVVPSATVEELKTDWEAVSFDGVPSWSDADIMEQFAATRETPYLTDRTYSTVPVRRISWLYPDDGCFARAEQVNARVVQKGKPRPYKLWAFGALRVYSPNYYPGNIVPWGWHVVPVVKNEANEPIVFDAALSPCKPLPWKTWLGMMVEGDLSQYDRPDRGEDYRFWGVMVSDPNAYKPWHPAFGDIANGAAREALSLTDEETIYLPLEWERQHDDLQRNAELLLGIRPPWSGSACLFTEVFNSSVDIAAGGSANASVSCPFATLNVGGGFLSSHSSLLISKNARLNNGWEIAAKNTGTAMRALSASAVCLTGAPQNASVSTVSSSVSISNTGTNSTTASCSSGVLVGGGYSTTVAGTPSSIMRIYSDGRTTSTGNTWQVSAYNRTGSSRSVTSYGYCLNNTGFTVSQTAGSLSPEGIATAMCPSPLITLGGGFTFPRTTPYYVATMLNQGSSYAVDMLPSPSSTDVNAKAHAECLLDPTPPSVCTEETATEMGPGQTPITVRGDSCLKITQYPGSWVGSVILQAQANGSGYPIPFTWTNCTNSGSGSLTSDWNQSTLRPVTNTCATVIDLNGSSSARVSVLWWGNG
jgi:hypothetical protein